MQVLRDESFLSCVSGSMERGTVCPRSSGTEECHMHIVESKEFVLGFDAAQVCACVSEKLKSFSLFVPRSWNRCVGLFLRPGLQDPLSEKRRRHGDSGSN